MEFNLRPERRTQDEVAQSLRERLEKLRLKQSLGDRKPVVLKEEKEIGKPLSDEVNRYFEGKHK